MATFDPKAARERSKETARGIPPGPYLLAIRQVKELKQSRNNTPYAIIMVQAIAGAAKGKTFRDILGLNTSSDGVMFRLSILFEQVRWDQPIDLEDIEQLREAIVDVPFKAVVRREFKDGYWNNSIERYCVGDQIIEADVEAMKAWEENHEPFEESAPRDEVPPPGDGDAPGYGYGGPARGGPDDDVPF